MIVRLRTGRLVLAVLILVGISRCVRSEGPYHVWFADGSEVSGKSIDHWGDHEKAAVAGRRLFDPKRPAMFLRDAKDAPVPKGSRVVLANGDVLPGHIVRIERAEDYPGRPVCLRVMLSKPMQNARTPQAAIPVLPRYIRRVVAASASKGAYRPGTILLKDGSSVSCQGMQWAPDGLRVLTGDGVRNYTFNELAEVHARPIDAAGQSVADALSPCPRHDALVARLTTSDGAALTFRPPMMTAVKKRWLLVQPVWSMHAIRLALTDVRMLSVRRHNEVPLSLLPAETLAEKAFTGFIWKWRRNRSVRGGPLVTGSLTGDLGIGTHAYSAIAFDLPPGAASFNSRAGLDDGVGKGGCVKLKVLPEKLAAKPLWMSGFVRGRDKPIRVGPLNCSGAKRLVLVTEFGHKDRPPGADPFDIRDEVNWIAPTLRLDPAVMGRGAGGPTRHFTGLRDWLLCEPDAAKVRPVARWDSTDFRWAPELPVPVTGLTLKRKVRVTDDTVQMWISAIGGEANHRISLCIDEKQVKCTGGQMHLQTASAPRSARWGLKPHLGKEVTAVLKILPTDPRRAASPLHRPEIWFTPERVPAEAPHVRRRPLRNMPTLVKGMVRVMGKDGRISGRNRPRYAREFDSIAYWWRCNASVEWEARIPKRGTYLVQLTYGCISRSAGTTYEIAVGDRKVRGIVRTTGRWATFTTDDAGQVQLDKAGPVAIEVKLLRTPGNGTLTLHAVTLVPVK